VNANYNTKRIVVGPAETTRLGVVPDASQTQLHANAALNAMADARLKPADIDGIATAGGLLVARLGVLRALLVSGVLQMLSNLMYVVQVWAGHDVPVVALTIGTENLTNGMGSAAFVAYLSGVCNVAFTATQYALLTSLASIGMNLSASGGFLADQLGWVPFFLIATVACLPGLGLLLWSMRLEGARQR
jgi:MFS transporter, PAT family, beta-lactamase induction signal transducer AmpG